MFERRSSRFAVEVLVVGLAVSVAIAQLSRLVIGGVMLLGWGIVSLLEWASARGEPHYGAGRPPRYDQAELRLPSPVGAAEAAMRALARASVAELELEPELKYEPAAPIIEEETVVSNRACARVRFRLVGA